MENNNLFQSLKTFISEHSGISEKKIDLNSCIEKDLHIYGDDAAELIIAYGEKFNVNISKFKAADYFSPEEVLSQIFKMHTHKKLTIQHLLHGVIAGKLDDETINSVNNMVGN